MRKSASKLLATLLTVAALAVCVPVSAFAKSSKPLSYLYTYRLNFDGYDTMSISPDDTGYLTVHIQVQDGAARFVDSPCPDHICEHYGWLREEDQTATCLPARAVLTIVPVS